MGRLNKSLFSSNKDDWETPQDFFDKLNNEFHFDLDIAASDSNHKCDYYFTKEDSAFRHDLFGVVWCNPPYGSEISKWVKLCHDYSGTSVMLLPARTDTRWFHNYIYNCARAEIRFIQGRLKFSNSKCSAPFPSMVVIFKDRYE